MTNFVLLLGVAVGLAGLMALSIIAGLKWLIANPVAWVSIIIGIVIGVVSTLKIKRSQDEELIRKYRRAKAREQNATPRVKVAKQPTIEPNEGIFDIDGLCEGLSRYGYGKSESREAIKRIISENPDASETDIITQAMHIMSVDKVRK